MTVDSQLALLESRIVMLERRVEMMDKFSAMTVSLGNSLHQMQQTLDTLMLQNSELDQRLEAFTAAVKGKKFEEPRN